MVEYKTVLRETEAEFTEKRSRFIGYIKPVESEAAALDFLAAIRQKHWDATHNVYAYIVRGGATRYSDDGEPQGTAGIPVLDVLRKSGVTDAAVVVTRYFGGVLLGGGGLVRAYGHAASLALSAAGTAVMRECPELTLTCSYAQYGRIGSLVPECGGVLSDTAFGENVTLTFHMAQEALAAFGKKLSDATNGQAVLREIGRKYYEFAE